MERGFPEIIESLKEIVRENLERNLYDSEIAALHCAWEGIEYKEFASASAKFAKKYAECYRYPQKEKKENSLMSGSSRIFRFLANYFDLEQLTRTNFRRTFIELCEQGIISIPEQNVDLESETLSKTPNLVAQQSSFRGRKQEFNLLKTWIKNNNIISIWGNPGIGKTAFIREYCDRYLQSGNFIYLNSSDFNSTDALLLYIYRNISGDSNCQEEDIRQSIIDFLSIHDFVIIVDFNYRVDFDFCEFLKSLTYHNISPNSCVITISRTNNINEYGLSNGSFLDYQIRGLENPEEYHQFYRDLSLEDSELWSKLHSLYEGNFREIIYVSTFIKEIFNGSIKSYLNLGSIVLSPSATDYFSSIKFSKVDYEIFTLFKNDDTCISINFFNFLKNEHSTSKIFSRISFLSSHGFLYSSKDDGQVYFSLSSLLRRHLIEEGKIDA